MYRGLSVTSTPTDRAQGAAFALLFLTVNIKLYVRAGKKP